MMKSVAVDPLKCFNRLVLVADRATTIEECLTINMCIVLPISLFKSAHARTGQVQKHSFEIIEKKRSHFSREC